MDKAQIAKFWSEKEASLSSMFLDRQAHLLDLRERSEIFSHLPRPKGKVVLDLACGTGRFTQEFAKRGAKKIFAVDMTLSFIEENKKNNASFSQIEYIHQNALDASFEENSLDFIFISWLFIYLQDEEIQKLVLKMEKWLRPNGLLFFKESCAPLRKIFDNGYYFAIYRNLLEYPLFFSSPWKKEKEENLSCFEALKADPFKWFWIYRLSKRC